jgi:hypothetical protein
MGTRKRLVDIFVAFVLGASLLFVVPVTYIPKSISEGSKAQSQSQCHEVIIAARDLHSSLQSRYLDQLTISRQRSEIIRTLSRKLQFARGNQTLAEKKLREVYGEKSRQDVQILQLQSRLGGTSWMGAIWISVSLDVIEKYSWRNDWNRFQVFSNHHNRGTKEIRW